MKITMLGAGSGFVLTIAKELPDHPVFDNSTFMLMDPNAERLEAAFRSVANELAGAKNRIQVMRSTDLRTALDGSDYVITSCEKNRYAYWARDFQLAEKNGVFQIKGEGGGPGGLIHGLRNICLYKEILEVMAEVCPEAWLMNFSNPMSILCTYFKNYFPKQRALGFCHQVHGCFGVIAEELGMEPGELEVIAAGVNHMSWLFDIRKRGTGKSFLKEFTELVKTSKYWRQVFPVTPEQILTRELFELLDCYPVGYDEHISEYMPFMQDSSQWEAYGMHSLRSYYEGLASQGNHTLETRLKQEQGIGLPPFPVNPKHPYYAENPCKAIVALATNTPTYFDAVNIRNNGAVDNLPQEVILDVPALAVGGDVRAVHVGRLPDFPAELCRRQTVLHEMIARGGAEGDDALIIQALCLDPFVGSLKKARMLWQDFRKAYREELTTFKYTL